MRRWISFAVFLSVLPVGAFCQSNSADSPTLQALLAELRQLHQELRTTTVAAQRAQILIYRVQAQETVVTRLSQRLDNERSRLGQNQSEQRRFISEIKRLEDSPDRQSESDRKQVKEQLERMKTRVQQLGTEEQEMLPQRMELEEQLRAEQAKLTQLHDELDRIDKTLEQASRAPASAPQ